MSPIIGTFLAEENRVRTMLLTIALHKIEFQAGVIPILYSLNLSTKCDETPGNENVIYFCNSYKTLCLRQNRANFIQSKIGVIHLSNE